MFCTFLFPSYKCFNQLSFGATFPRRSQFQTLAIGWALLTLSACNSLPEENQVLRKRVAQAISAVQDRPIGDSLTIDVAQVANFPWDTLYVFPTTTVVERISRAIGTPWPGGENVHEDDNLWVFMHQGQIADYVYFSGFNYQKLPNFVKFYGHFDIGELFTPATAKFKAVRRPISPEAIDLFAPRKPTVFRPGYNPKTYIPY
ncbi:hypothetical protein IC235_20985 [Hymenobacter sp. BT664]|uniref:Uncharacterized protein n=1 Tax=Hymenobacter montanus TaxID=2771359 RepID=A0A927BHI7_9BACT|nr:hypothetical protein [Hymenobacter montanus]MBD2770370.1 hypothetical protein [Hymenobacter montanus]